MLDVTTYNLLMATADTFSGAIAKARTRSAEPLPALPAILQIRGGYAESPIWYMVQAAEFDPEPLTVATIRVRDTYAADRIVQALLDLLAGEQWLVQRGQAYFLTVRGREMLDAMRIRRQQLLADLQPISKPDLANLECLLWQLIESSLQRMSPSGAWCLAHSRRRAPVDSAAPLAKIYHYFADFNAFRDDAHMAAFQPYEPRGFVWEAFAFVAANQGNSASALLRQLAFRGYTEDEFEQALLILQARGWIAETGESGIYYATAAGQMVRAEVERRTDQYFYAPWAALKPTEVDTLHTLLAALGAGLQALA